MDQDDLFLFSKKAKVKTIGYKAVKGKFKLTAEDKGKYLLGAVISSQDQYSANHFAAQYIPFAAF